MYVHCINIYIHPHCPNSIYVHTSSPIDIYNIYIYMSKFHGHHIFHTSNLTTMHLPHPTPWARDPQSAVSGRGRAVGPPWPHEVERVVDSSRYFVLKITNGDRHLGPTTLEEPKSERRRANQRRPHETKSEDHVGHREWLCVCFFLFTRPC